MPRVKRKDNVKWQPKELDPKGLEGFLDRDLV